MDFIFIFMPGIFSLSSKDLYLINQVIVVRLDFISSVCFLYLVLLLFKLAIYIKVLGILLVLLFIELDFGLALFVLKLVERIKLLLRQSQLLLLVIFVWDVVLLILQVLIVLCSWLIIHLILVHNLVCKLTTRTRLGNYRGDPEVV